MTEVMVEDQEQELLLVTFCLGEAWYGLDTLRIQEVILVGETTVVHHAPGYVRGIINLRGKIVTVLDLGEKLGLERGEVSPESRILIVPWAGEQVGLLVESVSEVVGLKREAIETIPLNVGTGLSQFLLGVFHSQDQLVGILDLEAVFAE